MIILSSLLLYCTLGTICKSAYYPRVFGATDGDFVVNYCHIYNQSNKLLAAGYTTSEIISGASRSKCLFDDFKRRDRRHGGAQDFEETSFNSFVNGATDGEQKVVLASDYPMKLAVTKDLG